MPPFKPRNGCVGWGTFRKEGGREGERVGIVGVRWLIAAVSVWVCQWCWCDYISSPSTYPANHSSAAKQARLAVAGEEREREREKSIDRPLVTWGCGQGCGHTRSDSGKTCLEIAMEMKCTLTSVCVFVCA